jgi:hypothetical protein
MISRGKNSAQIAKFLGRTRVSIFARKSKLGIDAKMSPARGSEMPYTHGTKTRNGNHKGRVKGSGKPTPTFTPPTNSKRDNVTPRTSLGAHLDALMATAKQAGIKVSVSFTSEDTNTNWL